MVYWYLRYQVPTWYCSSVQVRSRVINTMVYELVDCLFVLQSDGSDPTYCIAAGLSPCVKQKIAEPFWIFMPDAYAGSVPSWLLIGPWKRFSTGVCILLSWIQRNNIIESQSKIHQMVIVDNPWGRLAYGKMMVINYRPLGFHGNFQMPNDGWSCLFGSHLHIISPLLM